MKTHFSSIHQHHHLKHLFTAIVETTAARSPKTEIDVSYHLRIRFFYILDPRYMYWFSRNDNFKIRTGDWLELTHIVWPFNNSMDHMTIVKQQRPCSDDIASKLVKPIVLVICLNVTPLHHLIIFLSDHLDLLHFTPALSLWPHVSLTACKLSDPLMRRSERIFTHGTGCFFTGPPPKSTEKLI